MPPLSGVADLRRNGWPIWIGLGGRFTLDWVADLARNTQAGKDSELKNVFSIVERWHTEGSPYVKEAATIGLLEGLQSEDNASAVEPYLLPESRKWWGKVNEFWESGKLISE